MNHLVSFVAAIIATFTSLSVGALHIKPKPTPTPMPVDMIVRSGQYSYGGQELKYKIYLPKKGGHLTGNFSGVCSGPITGNFDSGPAQAAEGKASAACLMLLNKTLTATYVAHFNLKEGKAYIDWVGDIPYTPGKGSFTMNFEPVGN